MTPERIVIMGIGNILLKDEGIGVYTIQALKDIKLPENVEIMDAGTSALDALNIVGAVEKLIVVDAVKGGGKPGAIYRFRPCDITYIDKALVSLHQLSLFEALKMAKAMGNAPKDVVIIGIEPKETNIGLELSKTLKASIPRIIEVVKQELEN